MRAHPVRTLIVVLLVILGVRAVQLATADHGGVYDPAERS